MWLVWWFTLGLLELLILHSEFRIQFLEWIAPLQNCRVSIELSSRTVSRKVFSPLQSLTSVFGMGTGGPSAFVTLTLNVLEHWILNNIHSADKIPLTPFNLRHSLVYLNFTMPSFDTLYVLHRKEVIQPHLPIRLPCYDLTPIIEPTFDGCLLAVSTPASGVFNFHGLTGGVYKARERIHRDMLIRDY